MIAIHHRKGSFSDKWISHCIENNVDYKIVNAYSNNITEEVEGCDSFMWHWAHWNQKDVLFAKQLIYSLERKGLKVFPNSNTCWHFDDKVGQKYLLEALDLPLVPTYVFYDKHDAIDWIKKVKFPKVFKTRNGAGSMNVKLVDSQKKAIKLVDQAFSSGIPSYDKWNELKESIWKYRKAKSLKSILRLLKYVGLYIVPSFVWTEREKGYLYFQDFIAENDFDIRVIVIGNKAFAIKRMIRENDFRASGSGKIDYDIEEFDNELIKKSFQVNKKINSQSLAIDYIYDKVKKEWLIVEISYGFSHQAYYPCPGYWDDNLTFHKEKFYPEYFIIENILSIEKVG